jgi:hypothetical protein
VGAFYLDEGLALAIATELRALGHDATTADAEGRKGAPDEAQLWFAAQRGWIVLTHNGADFHLLHRAWIRWGVPRPHAGILVLEQLPTGLARLAAQTVHGHVQQQGDLTATCWDWSRRQGWRPYP